MTMRALLLALLAGLAVTLRAAIDHDLLRERVVADVAASVSPDAADGLAAAMTPEGAWADIDYADRHRTRWAPAGHLDRLRTIAVAFGAPDSPRFRDPALREALLRGLAHWQAAHPVCDNWWYNWIFAPQRLGEILLLAQHGGVTLGELPEGMLARWAAECGDPSKPSGLTTGSNRVNIAAHWCYRGILTRDEEVLRVGAEGVLGPLRVTDAEGLQRDLSYHQHGPQLYLGNYGYDWIELMAAWLDRFRDTALMPGPERAALVRRYALEAYFPAIRGQWYLFNAVGRQQASEPGRAKATKNLPVLRHLARLFPADRPAWEAARARLRAEPDAPAPEPRSTVFWRSDYALHVRPAFTFDVRAASVRTNRCEWGNNENLLGHWLAEGATGFAARGDEYADIAPLWDWWKIPGTTVVDRGADAAIPRGKAWGARGKATFVGGAAEGDALAFAYRRDAGEAPGRFAWLALGDAVVCLGAGLSADAPDHPLVTTVEQCWARGGLAGGTRPTPATLTHGAFRYAFPRQRATLRCAVTPREGNWRRVSSAFDVPAEGEVLTLWLDHGRAPKEAAYAYVVSPAALPPPQIEILANTPALQAARDASGRMACVFHEAGSIEGLTVDAPCVALRAADGSLRVADPTQTRTALTLTRGGISRTLALSAENGWAASWPAEAEAGADR